MREAANLNEQVSHVATWQEAMERAEPGVSYQCADGNFITFGRHLIKPFWRDSTPPPADG